MKTQPKSLQEYQQPIREAMQSELERQELQNTPAQSLKQEDRTRFQIMVGSFIDSVAEGVDAAKQYGLEVATGQKMMDSFFQNDGTVSGYLAHGSTELANMLLHGHPAPVYARTLSPAHQQAEAETGVHGESAAPQQELPAERQASQDVELPKATSMELYQRAMKVDHEQQLEQEIER